MDLIKGSKYTGKLLVVSFDGFRWDYTKYTDTPNFDSLEKYGTRVKYMNGVFPTKTFPSHVSIATGEIRRPAFLRAVLFLFKEKY